MIESSPRNGRHFLLSILACAVVFACVAPTLRWTQLTGGNENIVIQTALEIRRGGPWLVPSMLGEPRIKKPPLVAWITALTIKESTLNQLDHPTQRDRAYADLAWQVRWTGLLAGCVTMMAAFFLGFVVYSSRIGLYTCMICGTTLLFQKFFRQSTSDVHLAMWVTIANVGIAMALFRNNVWFGMSMAAVAAGLAFLCKGPVALLETILPLIVMILPARWLNNRRTDADQSGRSEGQISRKWVLPCLLSACLFACIALPWFVHVYRSVPDVVGTWTTEVSRQGATGLEPDPIYTYVTRIPMNWPWIVMLIVGVVAMLEARNRQDIYTLALAVAPILVLTLIPDRKERYLLPFVAPLALMAARGVMIWIDGHHDRRRGWIGMAHWVVLAGVCIGFPMIGALHPDLKKIDGQPWYPMPLAVWCGVGFVALIGLGMMFQRRWNGALMVCTFTCVLALQAVMMWGYKDSPSGRSALKMLADAIRDVAPDARVIDFDENVRVAEELAIYLNRTIVRADPATMQPTRESVVYITRQDRDESEPIAPAGFHLITRVKERKNHWWAFVRPSLAKSPAIQLPPAFPPEISPLLPPSLPATLPSTLSPAPAIP